LKSSLKDFHFVAKFSYVNYFIAFLIFGECLVGSLFLNNLVIGIYLCNPLLGVIWSLVYIFTYIFKFLSITNPFESRTASDNSVNNALGHSSMNQQ
jgi:hypothetical protein